MVAVILSFTIPSSLFLPSQFYQYFKNDRPIFASQTRPLPDYLVPVDRPPVAPFVAEYKRRVAGGPRGQPTVRCVDGRDAAALAAKASAHGGLVAFGGDGAATTSSFSSSGGGGDGYIRGLPEELRDDAAEEELASGAWSGTAISTGGVKVNDLLTPAGRLLKVDRSALPPVEFFEDGDLCELDPPPEQWIERCREVCEAFKAEEAAAEAAEEKKLAAAAAAAGGGDADYEKQRLRRAERRRKKALHRPPPPGAGGSVPYWVGGAWSWVPCEVLSFAQLPGEAVGKFEVRSTTKGLQLVPPP